MTLRPRETVVRFGVRAILMGTAAIAAFFGAATPALRVWSAAECQAFLAVWVSAFVGGIGFVVSYCLLRLRAERRAGEVDFELALVSARRMYFAAVFMSVAMLGLLVFMSLLQQRQAAMFMEMSKQGGTITFPSPLWSIPNGILIGMPLAMAGTFLWWRAFRVEFCEFGIVYFISFIPWSSVNCELVEGEPAVLTVRATVNRYSGRLRAAVSDKMLPQVREIVDNRSRAI